MKYSQRLLLVLCVLALFVACFSPLVSAEAVKKLHIHLKSNTEGQVLGVTDVLEGETGVIDKSLETYVGSNVTTLNTLTLQNSDGSIIMNKGKTYSVIVENLAFRANVNDNGSELTFNYGGNSHASIKIHVAYADGSGEILQSETSNIKNYVTFNASRQCHMVKLDIEAKDDITQVVITEGLYPGYKYDFVQTDAMVQYISGFEYAMKATITEADESLGWLEKIWNGLTTGFTNMVDNISNVYYSIVDGFSALGSKLSNGFSDLGTKLSDLWDVLIELPVKLWQLISDGLHSLFVPTEQSVVDFKEDLDGLLETKLGAVYQAGDLMYGGWQTAMVADETDTIVMPMVTIPLPGDNEFSFGGYEVRIVPEGFEPLADLVKLGIAFVCTLQFVNGLRKRYEEVVR